MSWLRKVFGGGVDLTPPQVNLDVEQRTRQLERLEDALDQLVAAMREHAELMPNPGWQERVAEYQRVAGEARRLRGLRFGREELLDLAFEVRPVFAREVPDGLEELGPLQDEAMAAAKALQEVLPGERDEEG